MHQGAKADICYGVTGATKSSRLGDAAEYLKRKYNKPSRLISASPGGWDVIDSLVRSTQKPDGIIQAFALTPYRTNLIETMNLLSQGWWPKDVADPQSTLIPPESNGLDQCAGVFFEDCTSWCDFLMRTFTTEVKFNDATQTISATNVRSPDMPKESFIHSGQFTRRFSGKADYGGIQDIIANFVWNSGHIPVAKVIWTALETRGEDEGGRAVYGPDFIGKKATGKCGPWFGNMLHLDLVQRRAAAPDPVTKVKDAIEVEVPIPMLFLRPHIDPTDPFKMPWPAKTRAPRSLHQEVPVFMEPRLDKFYVMMDALQEKERAIYAQGSVSGGTQHSADAASVGQGTPRK